MASCECIVMCPFFNDQMDGMPEIAEKLKEKYCLGSNVDCARYLIRQQFGAQAVPGDLFPNDKKAALRLIHDKLSA
ncbi:MAG: hypothetical protein JW739_02095 [Opitutales bacterium]|nr:hypothetical protein [Opitutales bacterium]